MLTLSYRGPERLGDLSEVTQLLGGTAQFRAKSLDSIPLPLPIKPRGLPLKDGICPISNQRTSIVIETPKTRHYVCYSSYKFLPFLCLQQIHIFIYSLNT